MLVMEGPVMLRPFNFDALPTRVYRDASRSSVQDASIPALIIITAGLLVSRRWIIKARLAGSNQPSAPA